MKQSLQLKLGHSLTLTPQLQQAIRLLQLSNLELQQEIREAMDSNPMLEIPEQEQLTSTNTDNENSASTKASDTALQEGDLPQDLPVDTQWDDLYQPSAPKSHATNHNGDEMPGFENFTSATESLQDHLMWQAQLTPMSDIDHAIATAIIDAIDDSGFLSCSLEDIQAGVGPCTEAGILPGLDEIEAVLHRIQQFDPIGVGARSLSECLLVQLEQLPSDTPHLNDTKDVVKNHIDLLAQHNYKQIMRAAKLNQEALQQAILLIQSLQPRPGDAIKTNSAEYVVPDVIVTKEENKWVIELNYDAVPKVTINNHYASMVKRATDTPDNNFLRDHLQEARWFIKSLMSRNETLLKVATCIVKHQADFLEHGEEAMKPLVLHDIASKLDMHESTISRVTTQKYMHTPRGVFELKYFFSSHVSTQNGGECSATAIRAVIKKLVAAENPQKPLSDNKIALILTEQGINVARRTIAKYRESLKIPASNERKSLFDNKSSFTQLQES